MNIRSILNSFILATLTATGVSQPGYVKYRTNYADCKFEHTKGVLNKINRDDDLNAWCKWSEMWNVDGTTKVTDPALKELMPNYSYITKNMKGDAFTDAETALRKRQRTHVMEHTLYAMPGESIRLYPGYGHQTNYSSHSHMHDVFIRWYDYDNGTSCVSSKNVQLLDFPQNQDKIEWLKNSSHDYGFVVSTALLDKVNGEPDYSVHEYPPVFKYPQGGVKLDRDYDIACDVSMKFDKQKNISTTINGRTLMEPAVIYRHIFHIKDGKTFADKISGSADNNEEYIRKNAIYVTAPLDRNFQIRLNGFFPSDAKNRTSSYVYKSDTGYERVHGCKIHAYNDDSHAEMTSTMNWRLDALADIADIGGKKYSIYRMLQCGKPQSGDFTVQIVGTDESGNELYISGSKRKLVLEEYHVKFVSWQNAHMVTEGTMKSITSKYRHYSEDALDDKYGEPKAVVNFDEYCAFLNTDGRSEIDKINNTGYSNNYITNVPAPPAEAGVVSPGWLFKWPVKWTNSQYGYGYTRRVGWFLYGLATNAFSAPSSENARKFTENPSSDFGLFDRLYYNNINPGDSKYSQGFFLYVDAATDPGVMARLEISDLCIGSQLHVSAWVADINYKAEANRERPNLRFNFVAVKKNGERVTMHSHITGYVPKDNNYLGRWLHIYFNFNLDFTGLDVKLTDVAHYELELDNNCTNTWGADYAIDDIRIWAMKPKVFTVQKSVQCVKGGPARMEFQIPWNVLLQSSGIKAASTGSAASENFLYYSIIDQQKYDQYINNGKSIQYAFQNSAVSRTYLPGMPGDGQAIKKYGSVSFKTHYQSNTTNPFSSTAMFRRTIDDTKYLCITDYPALTVGKKYYIVFYAPSTGKISDTVEADGTLFNPKDDCAKVGTFTVRSSGEIYVDGIPSKPEFQVCGNQRPVVQIDLVGDNNGIIQTLQQHACVDWYSGTSLPSDLLAALREFRKHYPDNEDMTGVSPEGSFTSGMWSLIINELDNANPKLHLYKSSYIMQTGETVFAIPIEVDHDDNVTICSTPIKIVAGDNSANSPFMYNGIPSIKYPDNYGGDAPLRLSLDMLTNRNTAKSVQDRQVHIPIRQLFPTNESQDRLYAIQANDSVWLCETNDPEYVHKLSSIKNGLMTAGMLKQMSASTGSSSTSNRFDIEFKKSFKFKEGYYYRFKFNFKEGLDLVTSQTCVGEDVFTIKVVPKYQEWTGNSGNGNWQDDRNWRRVSASELFMPHDSSSPYFTDGSNKKNTAGYAPLNFTYAVIPNHHTLNGQQHKMLPYLYGDMKYNHLQYTPKTIWYSSSATENFSWSEDPEVPQEDGSHVQGDPTNNVQYDMVGHESDDHLGLWCRPWRMNECKQIHFLPGSEIMHQEKLVYEYAWADMEVNHSRWTLLASPLQSTVAGDMYLPTDGAKQKTPLFTSMNFSYGSNGPYNRFKPAVFQRSWNANMATVVKLNQQTENVAIANTWSNVYNDVNVKWSAGVGFTVKPDVSKALNVDNSGLVRFRLPKADRQYHYYSSEGQSGNVTDIQRSGAGRLNPVSGTITLTGNGAAGSNIFLAGNPFMTHLDVKKFLSANSDKILPKYWIMTGGVLQAAVVDGDMIVGTMGDPGFISPMQGFFVQASSNTTSLNLTYNESMMKQGNLGTEVWIRKPGETRSDQNYSLELDGAKICILDSTGNILSSALLRIRHDSNHGYLPEEDVPMIGDTLMSAGPQVYTVAGDMASSINTLPDPDNVEIGVFGCEGTPVTLCFENTRTLDGYMLVDRATGEATPIEDGLKIDLPTGSVSNRFFITSSPIGLRDNTLKFMLNGNNLTVESSATDPHMNIAVYSVSGLMVHNSQADSNSISVTLMPGIYVVEASDGDNELRTRILVTQ